MSRRIKRRAAARAVQARPGGAQGARRTDAALSARSAPLRHGWRNSSGQDPKRRSREGAPRLPRPPRPSAGRPRGKPARSRRPSGASAGQTHRQQSAAWQPTLTGAAERPCGAAQSAGPDAVAANNRQGRRWIEGQGRSDGRAAPPGAAAGWGWSAAEGRRRKASRGQDRAGPGRARRRFSGGGAAPGGPPGRLRAWSGGPAGARPAWAFWPRARPPRGPERSRVGEWVRCDDPAGWPCVQWGWRGGVGWRLALASRLGLFWSCVADSLVLLT